MENYVKASLRVYPLLELTQDAYEQHIRNKALLSCNGRMNTEDLALYLAEQILHKRRLLWLQGVIEGALDALSEEERALVGAAFFGEKRAAILEGWSDSKRLRLQTRCFTRLEWMLKRSGLTKKYFEEALVKIEVVRKSYKRTLFESERKPTVK